jgi:radical SAM protein (TIGR01212 family)
MTVPSKRYYDFNTYLRKIFGCRVQKITVDAGFTCPNRDGSISSRGCLYCNARGSGTGAFQKGISISEQLIRGKQSLARRYKAKKFIAYFQAFTNTYAPLKVLSDVYEKALAVEDIVGLSIGTRPDCIDEAVLNLLQEYAKQALIWIEYGLQSAHDKTLISINRGHDVTCFRRAVASTKGRGIKICAHVILGLPGENRSHMLETADFLSNIGIDGLKLHLLYVVRGTALNDWYRIGRYQCLSQNEYVDLVCDFLERIPGNVVIQRLTGDPHPHELVAPQWALQKAETLAAITHRLIDRNTWQGVRCPGEES